MIGACRLPWSWRARVRSIFVCVRTKVATHSLRETGSKCAPFHRAHCCVAPTWGCRAGCVLELQRELPGPGASRTPHSLGLLRRHNKFEGGCSLFSYFLCSWWPSCHPIVAMSVSENSFQELLPSLRGTRPWSVCTAAACRVRRVAHMWF